MVTFDAIASLRRWAVEVDLGGRTVRIPPLSAADWLGVLMKVDVLAVFDLAEDSIDVEDMLIDGVITIEDAKAAAFQLVECAAGRAPWVAFTLAHLAAGNWSTIGADLGRMSVRFESIPVGAALDAIYGSLCRAMDEKGLKQLELILANPPEEFGGKPARRAVARPVRQLPAIAEQYVRVRPKTQLRRPQDRPAAPTARPTPPPEPPGDSGQPATTAPPPAVDSHPTA